MTTSIVYLNGELMPLHEARVPVLDRGFIFGDGVYEVIPVYAGVALRLGEHLRRLQASLDAIRLVNPLPDAAWRELVAQVVAANEGVRQSIYVQVTRGPAPRDHAFPKQVTPTVFLMSNPLVTPHQDVVQRGVAAVTQIDNRWLRCDIKATSLLPNVLLRQSALDQGAAECVLLRDGYVTEGAASNIFLVHDDTLLAPPKNHLMLPGITYDLVLELAGRNAIPFEVRAIAERELHAAQEIMLTSSTREVLAISTLRDAC
jgi:D-alanine transaminase